MTGLDRILEDFFDFWWEVEPLQATTVGIHTRDRELERWDADSLRRRLAELRRFLQALEAVQPADVAAGIDRDIVAGQIRWQLYALEQPRFHESNPLLFLQGPLDTLYLMALRDYAPAGERALAAAERLTSLPRLLEEARANLVRPVRIFVQTAAAVARSGERLISGVLPVYLGSALEDDREQFGHWENATRVAADALVAFAAWLEEDALARAGTEFGAGEDAFRRQLSWLHGLAEEPEQLVAWAGDLERRALAEMTRLAEQLTGRPDWREAVGRIEAGTPPRDLLGAYQDAVERVRAFLEQHDLVGLPPRESLQVTPTPEYLRPLVPYAAYLPPAAFEAEQRGIFLVTPPDGEARGRAAAGVELTTVHEAYPGHHLQFCRANAAGSVPRRVFWTSLFAEGWALYCEELMWQQGFLARPEQRLLQLKDLLWRSCRVHADVGLHTGGWTVERAVDLLVDRAGLDPPGALAEVTRYCSTPTQPLSYAVGMREILRLRDRARERQGSAFSLRAFHDELLSWGTIPPALVARGMGLD